MTDTNEEGRVPREMTNEAIGLDDAYPQIFDELLAPWADLDPDVNWYLPYQAEVAGVSCWYCNLQAWGGSYTVWHDDPAQCAMAAEVIAEASKQVAKWYSGEKEADAWQ